MIKNDDLIRTLLFRYEAEDDWLLFIPGTTSSADEQEWRERGHVELMMDECMLAHVSDGTMRLTSYGHSYLAAIRDDTIWNQTKSAAKKFGGASIQLMFDIATAYAKQKASEITGLPL